MFQIFKDVEEEFTSDICHEISIPPRSSFMDCNNFISKKNSLLALLIVMTLLFLVCFTGFVWFVSLSAKKSCCCVVSKGKGGPTPVKKSD